MHDTATLKTRTVEPEDDGDPIGWDGVLRVRLRPVIKLNDKQLAEFCSINGDLRIEQTADGELIIMAPAFWESGHQEAELGADFVIWARTHGGHVGGPNAGFRLPNTATRAPDVSWVSEERMARLTRAQRRSFAPVCPDFVLELRSRSDRLSIVKGKMVEYMENGARLGWLIDPIKKQVFIYRPDQPVEHLKNPATLSGEPVLAGFTLDLARVWQ